MSPALVLSGRGAKRVITASAPVLPYEYVLGRPERAPVVLLTGLFAGAWMWDETCTHLSARGFGLVRLLEALAASDETAAGMATLRAALQAVLERLQLPRVTLCGNSFGALVALDFATHHAESVTSLVLSGAPGLSPEADVGTGMPRSVRREHVVALAQRLFHDPTRVTPAMIDRTHALLSDRRHVANVVRALRAARRYPIAEALSRVACPTLLVWGEHDRVTPGEPWKQVARTTARAAFHAVPACGHSPMIERPREFNRILLEFLASGDE